jgi:hypothetical protein
MLLYIVCWNHNPNQAADQNHNPSIILAWSSLYADFYTSYEVDILTTLASLSNAFSLLGAEQLDRLKSRRKSTMSLAAL